MSTNEFSPCVLVVDDESLIRLVASDLLQDNGFATLEASNAAEALVVLSKHPGISVLLTDINMPGDLDGLGLARETHRLWPDVRIVVTSGRIMPTESEMPDACCFVKKPYTGAQLLVAIA